MMIWTHLSNNNMQNLNENVTVLGLLNRGFFKMLIQEAVNSKVVD